MTSPIRSRRARWAACVALATLGGLLASCSSTSHSTKLGATGAQPGGAAGSLAALPWLHVEHPAQGLAYIADQSGRQVQLRGVNSEGLEDERPRTPGTPTTAGVYPITPRAYAGRCPANSNEVAAPLCEVQAGRGRYAQSTADLSRNDFAQMRAQGFNAVRLAVSWSQIEPTAGHYSTVYLDRIAQVVRWAKEQGVYVLVDLHQDQYSRFIRPGTSCPSGTTPRGGDDGAPAWAVPHSDQPACGRLGQSNDSAPVEAAFDAFWNNATLPGVAQGAAPGPGLQDHYIGAIAAVARRFEADPTVLGYELMNEPQAGSANPIKVSDDLMYPFYRRAIEGITGVRDGLHDCPAAQPSGPVPATVGAPPCAYPDLGIRDARHLMLFEPQAVRNLVDFSAQHSAPFSQYANLVYAPHVYSHVFTIDSSFLGYPGASSPYPTEDFGYATAASEAEVMHAAVLVTEFGNGTDEDPSILAGSLRAQERWGIGGLLWTWKSNCDIKAGATCADAWPFYASPPSGPGPRPQNGAPQANRLTYMVRTYPMATAGQLTSRGFDPATGAFFLDATASRRVAPGDTGHETVVWVPARRAPKDPHQAMVIHAWHAIVDRVVINPDGSRTVFAAPDGAGPYGIQIGAPAAVARLVSRSAAGAPTPITFGQAQATLQQFLVATSKGKDRDRAGRAAAVRTIVAGILDGTGTIP